MDTSWPIWHGATDQPIICERNYLIAKKLKKKCHFISNVKVFSTTTVSANKEQMVFKIVCSWKLIPRIVFQMTFMTETGCQFYAGEYQLICDHNPELIVQYNLIHQIWIIAALWRSHVRLFTWVRYQIQLLDICHLLKIISSNVFGF